MTDLKQLTIAASLMVVAAAIALSPTAPPDQSYPSINYYGKRPQPIYRQENSVPRYKDFTFNFFFRDKN